MQKDKSYYNTLFDSITCQKILNEFQSIVIKPDETKFNILSIDNGNESWAYDTVEEYLSELRIENNHSMFWIENPELKLSITNWNTKIDHTRVQVSISSRSREKILRLGNYIESVSKDCFIPLPEKKDKIPPKPKIFIGHGGSDQWRDLKDHLQDKHGYEIVSYETGSRAGHTIRDIIDELLKTSSFGILVMTGEDVMEDGKTRARQNVIHELGLFQGRLGFTKAIVLKENGTEEFSNIHGVQQIRYSKNNIKETFGEVLGTLHREFGARQ